MENYPLVSIIVPVFNLEAYLPRCLDSIIAQTYKNLQIIVVDDGSTDNSLKIAREYAVAHKMVEVYSQPNQGVSIARNTGMAFARGKYLGFVDADDWIDANLFLQLVKNLEEHKVDYAACANVVVSIHPDGSFSPTVAPELEKNILRLMDSDGKQLEEIVREPKQRYTCSACGKLFKMDIVKKYHLRFPNGIKNGEDTIFTRKYIMVCKSIFFIREYVGYYVFARENSASRSQETQKNVNSISPIATCSEYHAFIIQYDLRQAYRLLSHTCFVSFLVLYRNYLQGKAENFWNLPIVSDLIVPFVSRHGRGKHRLFILLARARMARICKYYLAHFSNFSLQQ